MWDKCATGRPECLQIPEVIQSARVGLSNWWFDRSFADVLATRPRLGRMSSASPSARTSAIARSSSPPVRSSRWGSLAGATGRWALGSSRSARYLTPRTSRWGVRWTEDGAGRAHLRPHLQRATLDPRALCCSAAASRRCAVHRYSGWHRRHPAAAEIFASGPGPRALD
jgi:hypothetical protein